MDGEVGKTSPRLCAWCGERKELASGGEDEQRIREGGLCRSCRSREQEISKIWTTWGFDSEGLPLDGVWDDDAHRRDTQAKLEIDRRLEQLGLHKRWIDLGCGGALAHHDFSLGRVQAFGVAVLVNRKWGFDSHGYPVGDLDDEPKRRAAALEEIKKIFGHLGLPLSDDWHDDQIDALELTGG